jgi:hypothetical protein
MSPATVRWSPRRGAFSKTASRGSWIGWSFGRWHCRTQRPTPTGLRRCATGRKCSATTLCSPREWTANFRNGAVGTNSLTLVFFYFFFRFAQKLPEQYKLLRRKLFRIPQWTSSEEDEGDSDGHEPQTVRPDSDSHILNRKSSTSNLMPSRSRSLSASLEQEADMRRAEPKTRKVLQREVSMSKVFKGPRRNAAPAKVEAETTTTTTTTIVSNSTAATHTQVKRPIVLVEGTPQKPKAKARSKKH